VNEIVLVINAGSSSIKFSLFALAGSQTVCKPLYRGAIENIGVDSRLIVKDNRIEQPGIKTGTNKNLDADSYEAAIKHILNWLEQLPSRYSVVAVGHRVVHGGMQFSQPVKVDRTVLAQLQALVPLAPLHQPQALRAIDSLLSMRPKMPQIACFDTAFHTTMPWVEQTFALPRALAKQGIRRYGFHGLSYEYIAGVLPGYLGKRKSNGRVIVAHLGHGASMCAMRQRKSVATTMSFTPLDGLAMSTRCGSIDAAVVLYLMRQRGMTVDEISDLLHHQSGLLGLSGISGDMHNLLAMASNSTESADAIAVFSQRVHRELGALAAALGGLDAVVFTGGIGEHAAPVRAAVCRAAAWLGIALDDSANNSDAKRISADNSRVSVWVIPTDEEHVIAHYTASMLESRNSKPNKNNENLITSDQGG